MLELPSFEPMEDLGVNCSCFLSCEVGPVLEIVMLSLLFRFQVKACESSKIFLTNCLVNSSTAADALSVIVCRIGPPVGLSFYITNYHIFDCDRQAWDLPGDVSFPAAPCLAQMLENCLCFVSLDSFRHHIVDVFDHC